MSPVDVSEVHLTTFIVAYIYWESNPPRYILSSQILLAETPPVPPSQDVSNLQLLIVTTLGPPRGNKGTRHRLLSGGFGGSSLGRREAFAAPPPQWKNGGIEFEMQVCLS